VRLLVRWYLAPQAVVLTNMGAKEAISRSCALLEGHWWQTAGYIVITLIPSILITAIVAAWPPGELVSALVRSAFSVLILPLIAAFWTLLFLDLPETVELDAARPVTRPASGWVSCARI
jgi:hypothetical protein